MCSLIYDDVLNIIKELSSSLKRRLIFDISRLLEIDESKNISELVCPRCSSKYVVKNGKNNGRQKYLCKSCKRSFVVTTNTPVYHTKKDLLVWAEYIECLVNSKSLRKTAKELNIAVSTAFFWRHKILDALRENEDKLILKGKIQCDETFFKESFKGNHSKDGFKMPRKPLKRGTHSKYRGISRDQVCVFTALDSSNSVFINPIAFGKPSGNDLIRAIGKSILKDSVLISDSLYSYRTLCSFCSIKHIEIPKGKHVFKGYNIQKVNSLHSKIKSFMKPYKGVATKYLANYLALIKYILRREKTDVPFFIRGQHPYLNTNFKARPPIFI